MVKSVPANEVRASWLDNAAMFEREVIVYSEIIPVLRKTLGFVFSRLTVLTPLMWDYPWITLVLSFYVRRSHRSMARYVFRLSACACAIGSTQGTMITDANFEEMTIYIRHLYPVYPGK